MKYRIFPAQAAAQAHANRETAKLPRGPQDITRIWDIPRPLKDGRFAVGAHTDDVDALELGRGDFEDAVDPNPV